MPKPDRMIQIVLVKWGDRYGPPHVNGLSRIISSHTEAPLRFVCITDDAAGLDPEIAIRPFPDMHMPEELLRTGCLRKLSMFVEGVLEPGLRTLYFDLDTAVLGDVAKLAACLDRDRGLYMLSNHYMQHWKLRPVYRRFSPETYYFGNSSVLAYYPEDYYALAADFIAGFPSVHAEAERSGIPKPRHWRTDERWISYHARDTLRVFPDPLAARFQDAYMAPSFWLSDLRDRLPGNHARRMGRVALTFSGKDNKPERLARIEDGDPVVKGRLRTRWRYPELKRYWQELEAAGAMDPAAAEPSR